MEAHPFFRVWTPSHKADMAEQLPWCLLMAVIATVQAADMVGVSID